MMRAVEESGAEDRSQFKSHDIADSSKDWTTGRKPIDKSILKVRFIDFSVPGITQAGQKRQTQIQQAWGRARDSFLTRGITWPV